MRKIISLGLREEGEVAEYWRRGCVSDEGERLGSEVLAGDEGVAAMEWVRLVILNGCLLEVTKDVSLSLLERIGTRRGKRLAYH